MILTVDLGTSRTKAVVWGERGAVARGEAAVNTRFPAPGRAEQDPADWWTSVVAACASLDPGLRGGVGAVGFSAARQTFVPVAADGTPLGAGLLWSDRRAGTVPRFDPGTVPRFDPGTVPRFDPGTVPRFDPGTVTAKLAWLAAHEPDRLAAARWVLAPRDLIVWRLTGEVATDETLASAAGLAPDHPLAPPVVAPSTVVGHVLAGPAAALGVRPGLPVVIGAGDRQCEALATDASAAWPMVSWGTTANVSAPVLSPPDPIHPGLLLTRAASAGWLVEGGLSAAGSLLEWLAALTGVSVDGLVSAAAARPPGAGGLLSVPWLGGARAPWWRPEAGAAFVGLGPHHGAGDLARAAVEAVAWDVLRCIEALPGRPSGLSLAGGAGLALWVSVLTSVTALPARRRSCADSASVGAALLASDAVGGGLALDRLNPVVEVVAPDDGWVADYGRLRGASDAAACPPRSPSPRPRRTRRTPHSPSAARRLRWADGRPGGGRFAVRVHRARRAAQGGRRPQP